jgi:hypothetical protein
VKLLDVATEVDGVGRGSGMRSRGARSSGVSSFPAIAASTVGYVIFNITFGIVVIISFVYSMFFA